MPVTDEILLEELAIEPEFESVIPPLAQLEFDQLQKNILEDKEVYHPIIVWGHTIVDGHKRYRILKENPQIPFRTRKLEFADKYEAIAWICKNQIGRRNLSDAQMTILIGRQYEAEKMSHGGVRTCRGEGARPQNEVLLSGSNMTARKIAEEHGISRASVERAGEYVKALDIAKKHDANIEKDIMSGAINPAKKDVIQIGKAPKEEVPKRVEQLREQKPPVKKNAGNTINSISASMAADKPPATESDMLVSLQAAVKMLIRTFDTTFKHYPDMLKKAEHRTAIKGILNELKKYLNRIEEGEST